MGYRTLSQSSPGVERVAAVLNYMADHPDHSFTMSELVRALKLSRTTCNTLISGLVKVGYVYRSSDKTYVLGPALAAIGQVAAKHASPLLVAQPEMRALADEFDLICSAFFRERDHLVVRERVASASNLGWSSAKGARIRLRAPLGAIFFAWSSEKKVAAWLASAPVPPNFEQERIIKESMTFARHYGFSFTVRSSHYENFSFSDIISEDSLGETEFPTIPSPRIEKGQNYYLTTIFSPVFDANGEVIFTLSLAGFTGKIDGENIIEMGGRLRESCDRITKFTGGRVFMS